MAEATRILVVDDSPLMRAEIARILKASCRELPVAPNAAGAGGRE